MANDCLPQVAACVMRVARLDGSGVPAPGASNLYVTDALTKVTRAPQYEDGDEIKQKNGCGAVCLNYKSPPSYLREDITIELCAPDPELMQMLIGGTVLTSGARVGQAGPAIGVISAQQQNGVSIELWAKRIRNGVQDATNPWAWYVFPKVTNTKLTNANHENAAHLPSITGEAYENLNWFNGPLNDWPAASDKSWQWLPWNTVPTASCGYRTLAAT
jgi:hypothetical protein